MPSAYVKYSFAIFETSEIGYFANILEAMIRKKYVRNQKGQSMKFYDVQKKVYSS